MATRKKVINAIEKIGGKLIDNCSSFYYDIDLVAPVGFSWGGCHSMVVHRSNCGDKSKFWDECLSEIECLEVVKCNNEWE